MDKNHRDNSLKYWNEMHQKFEKNAITSDDWLERFDDIIMQAQKPILDLGCGSGNDTLYLTSKGKKVIACDQSEVAVNNIKKNFPEIEGTKCFNMLDGFPFEGDSFDVIVADLCLHYFTEEDTYAVLTEIGRILMPGGHLILRVNSINDVDHGAGQGVEIEHHLYETGSRTLKRFFDEEDIRIFFKDFEIEYINEETMSRYKLEKKLFRVCVRNA